MTNSLTTLRVSINSYYNKSRNTIILRAPIRNKLIEFQTDIKCTYSNFTNVETQLLIQDQIKILAICISKYDSIVAVRMEYYKKRALPTPNASVQTICFFNIIEEFINVHERTLSPNHLRNFSIMKRSLKHFHNNDTLQCEKVTIQLLTNYSHYLVKKRIENSTIKGYLNRLKRVVRYAKDHLKIKIDLHLDLITHLKEKQQFVVFLDRKEVEKFSKVYTSSKGEEIVKNGFLFRCYTGIRFSEMPYIDVNNLDGNSLSFYIPKTSKSHTIPLNGKALELLMKLKRFNPISQQKENQYLKVLARRAKIDRPVQKVKLSGSVSIVETHPKWKLCSSHTARRTWARIAYEAGIDILKISRYIGHSDIATTLKYIGHKDTDFDELKDLF